LTISDYYDVVVSAKDDMNCTKDINLGKFSGKNNKTCTFSPMFSPKFCLKKVRSLGRNSGELLKHHARHTFLPMFSPKFCLKKVHSQGRNSGELLKRHANY